MTKRGNASSRFFHSATEANLRPFGAPLSRGRRENAASQTSHEEGLRYENAAFPHCHFERKREIFFVRGQAKNVRGADSGKHRAPSESEGRCFMQTALRRKTETRERLFPFLFNLLRKLTPPRCARQPLPREGARVDTPSFLWKEGECRLTDFPRRRLTIRECRFPTLSFRAKARNLFRSRSGKGCEDSGEREAPCSQ